LPYGSKPKFHRLYIGPNLNHFLIESKHDQARRNERDVYIGLFEPGEH